ncbi:unnamed protein product, partial [Staurois parvus]
MSASNILLTTIHVITDWPISDHDWDLTQRSHTAIDVLLCPHTASRTGSRCCALPGSAHKQGAGRPFI